eukprot:scaffold536762_cov30-Prasinocladus_malaysianus.AAC.1
MNANVFVALRCLSAQDEYGNAAGHSRPPATQATADGLPDSYPQAAPHACLYSQPGLSEDGSCLLDILSAAHASMKVPMLVQTSQLMP